MRCTANSISSSSSAPDLLTSTMRKNSAATARPPGEAAAWTSRQTLTTAPLVPICAAQSTLAHHITTRVMPHRHRVATSHDHRPWTATSPATDSASPIKRNVSCKSARLTMPSPFASQSLNIWLAVRLRNTSHSRCSKVRFSLAVRTAAVRTSGGVRRGCAR